MTGAQKASDQTEFICTNCTVDCSHHDKNLKRPKSESFGDLQKGER